MLRQRIRKLEIPIWARNRALHHLANDGTLSDDLRYRLTQVVLGYITCDEEAARAGLEWMRKRDGERGLTPTF
jgi:hypothetical protein